MSANGKLELVQGHAHRHIRVLYHLREFLEADFAVAIQVGLHDGLVDDLGGLACYPSIELSRQKVPYLLQLLVLEVASNHHLQHNEKFPIADISVAINVVHPEGKPQLLLLVPLAAERRQPRNKLLEVNVASPILVEYGNHARRERVGRYLGER